MKPVVWIRRVAGVAVRCSVSARCWEAWPCRRMCWSPTRGSSGPRAAAAILIIMAGLLIVLWPAQPGEGTD